MLIGRQRELEFTTQCLNDIHVAGVPVVLLSGEPGIGKSTLLATIRALAAERSLNVAEYAAYEESWSPPYAAWSDILEQLGQPESQSLIANTDGASSEEHRHRVQHAVLASIQAIASVQPVVILIDDIQWLDQPSRDVMLHTIRGLATAPVLMIAAMRTPISERDAELQASVAALHREPSVRSLELAGMPESEVGAVAEQQGLSATPEAIRHLTNRTGGNPFFVSELARLMADSGAPTASAPQESSQPDIPASIRHVVQLRFRALPEQVQQMLRVVAIFPQGCDFLLLSDMIDADEDTLLEAIDIALDRDFLRPTDRGAEHYRFVHDIVRETIVSTWTPSRRARLHRRAAEALERAYSGRTAEVANELALHYDGSRSIAGAQRGVVHALAAADQALQGFDHTRGAEMLGIARALASAEPLNVRAGIEWRWALALIDAVRIDEGADAADRAVEMMREAGASSELLAEVCWRLASALNAVGAPVARRNRLREVGLEALGSRRDVHWARLRLLADPIEVIPGDALFAARWVGFDTEALRIARQSGSEEDVVQTIESFDPRTPQQTRELIASARTWQQPRATLRGLTASANDLTYRHAAFRQAMNVWNEVLELARRVGATPWEANALNQITLLHVTFGEFEAAVTSKRLADAANALLGPANDTDALQMERDFALTHYLDGDWAGQADFWLQFAGDPPQGLEAQLAAPLYAAMAASAAASAQADSARALELVDALAAIATVPGIQQANGVVAWAADAVYKLGARDRAETFDRLAVDLISTGIRDYPQTSLYLTRARMLALLDDSRAQRMFAFTRETLASQKQTPLLGIAWHEQAMSPQCPPASRRQLLQEAINVFESLGMTSWHERSASALANPTQAPADVSGISRREMEVLRLVVQGYSDRRVADELFISERTVNAHLRNMLQKTETGNRTELSGWARDRGILEP